MNTAKAIATHIRNCENLASPFWKLVTGGAWLSAAAMRPKTASAHVATTIPVPDPDWTTVPISAQHGRSPNPGSPLTASVSLLAACDSPVTVSYTHDRLVAWINLR